MEREVTEQKKGERTDKKLTAATNCTTAENFRAATLYSSVLSAIFQINSTIRETDMSLFPG